MSRKPQRCVAYVRIRPLLKSEEKSLGFGAKQLQTFDSKNLIIADDRWQKSELFTCFKRVIGPEATQQDLYQQADIGDLVEHFTQGYHTTLIAYGQRGSGKTHAIFGPKEALLAPEKGENLGIFPRAMFSLLDIVKHMQFN